MTFASIVGEATKLITSFILWFPLFFFVWMVADIIWTSGNPEKRKQAGQRLTWGIVAMFIFISIGGIIAVLDQTFFSSNATITAPPGAVPQNTTSGNSCFSTPDCMSGEVCQNGLCVSVPTPTPRPAPPSSSGGSSNCQNFNGQEICAPTGSGGSGSGASGGSNPFTPPGSSNCQNFNGQEICAPTDSGGSTPAPQSSPSN